MKFHLIPATAVMLALAGTASAQEWSHASPGMGQHEGLLETEDGATGINYACADSYSQVGFKADGVHVAAGVSTISVDGEVVAEGNTTYNSKWDATSFTNKVESEWGPKLKNEHNKLVQALAQGAEAIWTTPNGESFNFSLKGSSDIVSCLIK
ncbi:hypothetical protein ACGYLO_11830 [Sulfitobacter sp. 1A13353]|uniref:hypothetical protein n=1 Tax=Sulfitobacter sp. 1A13353 TaxID=3368568 RepID=UPI00374546AE